MTAVTAATVLIVALSFFLGALTQSVAGFGMALVAMPLLAHSVGLEVATPLMALVGMVVRVGIMLAYREPFELRAMGLLTLAAVLATPLGVLLLAWVDDHAARVTLGVVVVAYAVYMLLKVKPPRLAGRGWPWVFGIAAGVLHGAFNAGGPPAVVYASTQDWTPEAFKSNLQVFAIVVGVGVIVSHAVAGNYTVALLPYGWAATLASVLGLLAGVGLARLIPAARFQKVVLVLLIVTGLNLMV